MDPVARAVLSTWRVDPLLIAVLLAAAALYLRGWSRLRATRPERHSRGRVAAFLAALALVWIAIGSPLDGYADLWLRAHMLQHLLLMSAVPPLLWLGAPYRPLLVGLPGALRREVAGALASDAVQRTGRFLARPAVAALLLAVTTWTWHVPAFYELALRDPFWHEVEHATFLGTSLLLWFAIVQPPPAAGGARAGALLALALTVLQTSILAAIFVFSDRVLYASYAAGPQVGRLSPFEDQVTAGALLWLFDSIVTLTGAMLATVAWLTPPLVRPATAKPTRDRSVTSGLLVSARTSRSGRPFDLLAAPVGRLLARRGVRIGLRAVLLGLAVLVVWDGFRGPPSAYANAAGVLPWTHWRGFAVLALLVGGNFFCMACPFTLPRDLGRRLFAGGRSWPRVLRSKWLAATLVVVWLCAYEALAPWDVPAFTAWLVAGYFAAALAVDGWFHGASFCKYVCPIGQFHFVQSLASPLEVKVRDASVCAGCRTHDCLRGNASQRGCELDLFLPKKVGNLDCTFCLDCADACPHGNVGILATSPGAALADGRPRSSIGRLGQRIDLAVLALVLTFGAFASAAAMTAPGGRAKEWIAALLGVTTDVAAAAGILVAVVLVPALAVGGATWTGARLAGTRAAFGEVFARLAIALVPVGAGMWAAHFTLHLVAGWAGVVPVAQRLLADAGVAAGVPDWSLSHAAELGAWLRSVEILLLDAGLLLSLHSGWRIAGALSDEARRSRLWLPWALVAVGLWLVGVWLVFQPMEMRGTMVMS